MRAKRTCPGCGTEYTPTFATQGLCKAACADNYRLKQRELRREQAIGVA